MRRATSLLLILAALVVAACAPPGQVVGDSISVPIPASQAVHIDASGGRTTYNGGHGPATGSALEKVRLLAPRVKVHGWVIIEIGANDVAVQSNINDYIPRVTQMINAIPLDRCVAFVTVYRPAYQARVNAWNAFVRWFASQRPCWHLIRWAEEVTARPGLVGGDRLHPTPAGYRWLYDAYQSTAALPWGTRG